MNFKYYESLFGKMESTKNDIMITTQMRIAEADNTAQYWPNFDSQQSTIVIKSFFLSYLIVKHFKHIFPKF